MKATLVQTQETDGSLTIRITPEDSDHERLFENPKIKIDDNPPYRYLRDDKKGAGIAITISLYADPSA